VARRRGRSCAGGVERTVSPAHGWYPDDAAPDPPYVGSKIALHLPGSWA
jgi:hypothetical protein